MLLNKFSGGDDKNKIKWQAAFGLSVAGIIMLIYYMGRTHNRSLFTWLCPCFILLVFILENVFRIIKREGVKKGEMLCAFIIIGLLFTGISVYGTSEIYVLKNSERYRDFINRQLENNYDDFINIEIALLHKYEDNHGTVNYLGDYAAVISMAADVKNNFLGEMAVDWFTWDDYGYIESFLESCDGYIIIDSTASAKINEFIPEEFSNIISAKGYSIVDESERSVVYGLHP